MFRRVITSALLALFIVQSSRAAMASPVTQPLTPSVIVEIQVGFSQVLQLLAATHVGAFILGRESQYEAMHAPAPDFSKVRALAAKPLIRPDLRRSFITPVFHAGVQVHTRIAEVGAFQTRTSPRDPLAMRNAGQKVLQSRPGMHAAIICMYCHPAKISAPGGGAPTLNVKFSNGQAGSMTFRSSYIAITIDDRHGVQLDSMYTEVRWQWDSKRSDATRFNGGAPFYRKPFAGINVWIPINMQNDAEKTPG